MGGLHVSKDRGDIKKEDGKIKGGGGGVDTTFRTMPLVFIIINSIKARLNSKTKMKSDFLKILDNPFVTYL